ncbi:hypothetical protein HGRIS_003171 [Hohenbuehelia grisea]|uniref:Uncharacterized protein n=1 Tax=Hohenbuehelia grisea TaxID=104357 RepID=A0ABR3JMP1_9AGAR
MWDLEESPWSRIKTAELPKWQMRSIHDHPCLFGLTLNTHQGQYHAPSSADVRDRVALVYFLCHGRRIKLLLSPLLSASSRALWHTEGSCLTLLPDNGTMDGSLTTRPLVNRLFKGPGIRTIPLPIPQHPLLPVTTTDLPPLDS